MENYHRHSHYSNLVLPDSVVTNEDYARRAVELGQKCLFSTEHGTQGNYRECFDLAEKYGLRFRYGVEAYFVPDRTAKGENGQRDRTNAHLILLAKTEKGVYDLNFALSEAQISGFYYRPRLDLELLQSLSPRDVFVTTACIGGIWAYGWDKERGRYDFREPDRLVHALHEHFGESFMLEVQYQPDARQKAVNEHILQLYRQHSIPMICGLDSHFIHPEQDALRRDFLASKHLCYEDESVWFMDYPDEETAFSRFRAQGVLSDAQIAEAMNNTEVVLDFEDVSFSKARKLPTLYPEKTQEERNELYRQLLRDAWRAYRKDVPKDQWDAYLQGIVYEADTITDTATSDYFLISHAFVERYKALGGEITRTGRGSAPSYFTNMLLGLSSIDRFQIPVTMYPDRFVSRERLKTSMPDIDNNLSDQPLAAKALSEVMGAWHSAQMIACGTLKRLSAWKMYCRAAGVDAQTANRISDDLKRYELAVKHAEEDARDQIDVFSYVPKAYHDVLRKSEQYIGLIDSVSPHPCAFLLCQGDIRREIGIFRLSPKGGKSGAVYAAFIDGQTAEAYGYLKEDLLAVDVVKLGARIYERIGMAQPTVPKLMDLVEGDEKTWSMYQKGFTLGLNQVEREKSTERVMRYRPRNLTELSAFVAGIRPAFASMVDRLIERKPFSYGIPAFDALIATKEMPSSFILYQEQMMKTLQYAGFTASESYAAIKAIAKKHPEKVLPLKEKFLQGFSAKLCESGAGEDQALSASGRVWTIINDACNYLFNSSHSVSVALDSLYIAWAKAHHPLETYVELMRNYAEKGDKDRIDRARREMGEAFGIRSTPPRFGQNNVDYFIDKEKNTISDSLVSVKGIGLPAARALAELGRTSYPSFTDLLLALANTPAFNKSVVESLIRLGYFESFGGAKKLLSVFRAFHEGKGKFSKSHIEATKRRRLEALRCLERETEDADLSVEEKVGFEAIALGSPVTVDPSAASIYVVTEIDEKYSPKLKLYQVATGRTGRVKIKKSLYKLNPMMPGTVILMTHWEKRQATRFADGRVVPVPGVMDCWMENYIVLWRPESK